jgi:hypothetical protein
VCAFFEARIEHLTPADCVRVECLGKIQDGSSCNRVVLIAVQGSNQPGRLPISELKRYLRCDNGGERGQVDLTIVWADR